MDRAILIVLDGLGAGALPDAAQYGDAGSDTLGHTAQAVGGLSLPALQALGLGNVHPLRGVPPAAAPLAAHARLGELSPGKDSTTGHWELMGVILERPFPTYPRGFPPEVMDAFRRATGRQTIGNLAASGTEIIQRLGDEHRRTGALIVYTSADSVFQIAAHEQIVPVQELYRCCEIARDLLRPPHAVGRVIARPFAGESGRYERTPRRRDFSLPPPAGMLLPALAERGVRVVSIGKIRDLFAGAGITEAHAAKGNDEGMARLAELYAASGPGPTLFLLNLVDFDMLWGHRNDPAGMAAGLERFDRWLGAWLPRLRPGDLLLLTADHGNDPTTPSTDHSREQVPLLAWRGGPAPGPDLGLRDSFADVGATLADFFRVPPPPAGASFLGAVPPPRGQGDPT